MNEKVSPRVKWFYGFGDIAIGYQWADLSLTGEDNPDTWDLTHHMGAKVYKRYRFYKKGIG